MPGLQYLIENWLSTSQRRRRLFILPLLLCVIFLMPGQTRDIFAQDRPDFQRVDCSIFELPAALLQARQVECGWVTVPELHQNPTGSSIRLGTAILRSSSTETSPIPLFMMQGGPGGSTLNDFPLFLMLNSKILASPYDIVLFDQRGTKFSEPRLDCPEEMELTLQTLDKNLSDEESLRLSQEALKKCYTRLVNEGINLSAYDSVQNAGDVDAVRRALGYDKIHLYGVSYGTLLALQVMQYYPQGLASVVLDSVVAPQINDMVDGIQPQARSIQMVFDACAADSDCRQAFPDLQTVFYEQVDRLNQSPVMIDLTDNDHAKTYPALMDGDSLIYTSIMMMFNTEMIPLVPQMIFDVRKDNYRIVEQVLSSVTFDRSFSWGMFYSVKCAEESNFTADEVDNQGLPRQFIPLSENTTQSFLLTCALWNVEDESAVMDRVVSSDIPTLILSGAFDPTTPPHYAEEVAKTLPNSYSFLFPSGGHGELFGFDCAVDMLFEFLDNPTSRPDGSCIPNRGPDFVTSKTVVRLPVILKFLNLQGTSAIELILFALSLFMVLTAFVVYPIAWVIGLMRGRPSYAGSQAEPYSQLGQIQPVRPGNPPAAWKLAPWLVILCGGMLFVFTVVLVMILVGMVTTNDVRFLIGLPGSARPLFVVPPLTAMISGMMLVLSLLSWLRGWGSVLSRIYYTLLALAALACILIMAWWGFLTAVIA